MSIQWDKLQDAKNGVVMVGLARLPGNSGQKKYDVTYYIYSASAYQLLHRLFDAGSPTREQLDGMTFPLAVKIGLIEYPVEITPDRYHITYWSSKPSEVLSKNSVSFEEIHRRRVLPHDIMSRIPDKQVDPVQKAAISEALKDIEDTYGVRILYACESGSRAWGFPSPDSDYDVRFIYVHPPEWYLRVFQGKDNIDLPNYSGLLDFQGWDVRKALGLLAKGNPTLTEWFNSPIIYRRDDSFCDTMSDIMPTWFSVTRGYYHYYSMAKNNYEEHLTKDEVRLKKYFYVIRPLLCVKWIVSGKGTPPMLFEELVSELITDSDVLDAIHQLLERKRRAGESEYGDRIPVLDQWITDALTHHKGYLTDDLIASLPMKADPKTLDPVMYRTVMENK